MDEQTGTSLGSFTGGVANAAERAWNWGQAPCRTVGSHWTRAVTGEAVRGLRCRLHGSTLAEITLQTRAWTEMLKITKRLCILLKG